MPTDRRGPILVVDDDMKIRALVRTYLERAGFAVVEAADGEAALGIVTDSAPALIVLDVMLPVVDGLSVLEQLRADGDMPVIMLSARGTTADRIAGLTIGADDYLPKPFSPAELVARVHRVLDRSHGPAGSVADERPLLRAAGLVVDRGRHLVEVDGRQVDVTVTEIRLLSALLEADARVLSRDQLLDAVYGAESAGVLDRAIDVLVKRLRHKLGDTVDEPRFISTVRGVGYRFARSA